MNDNNIIRDLYYEHNNEEKLYKVYDKNVVNRHKFINITSQAHIISLIVDKWKELNPNKTPFIITRVVEYDPNWKQSSVAKELDLNNENNEVFDPEQVDPTIEILKTRNMTIKERRQVMEGKDTNWEKFETRNDKVDVKTKSKKKFVQIGPKSTRQVVLDVNEVKLSTILHEKSTNPMTLGIVNNEFSFDYFKSSCEEVRIELKSLSDKLDENKTEKDDLETESVISVDTLMEISSIVEPLGERMTDLRNKMRMEIERIKIRKSLIPKTKKFNYSRILNESKDLFDIEDGYDSDDSGSANEYGGWG